MQYKNQLFIHPTDQCNMNCEFCIYSEKHRGCESSQLDLERGYARQNLNEIMEKSQHVAFSGGGEPLLNTDFIASCIASSNNRKFMVTTGLGMRIEEIEKCFERINEACHRCDALCVIRISVDTFHKNIDFSGNAEIVMKWFIEKRWDRVRTCFIRGVYAEGKQLLKNLRKFCWANRWSYFKKKINKYTYAVIINRKFFQVILRPTIFPDQETLRREEPMTTYIDNMLKIDTEEIYLGHPRSCRGCKGCDSWKSDMANGLDLTINAKGDVYLYGAEVKPLGNIYDEVLNHEVLMERVRKDPELVLFETYDVQTIMNSFLQDEVLGDFAAKVNYPFAVIREAMKDHSGDVHRVLQKLIGETR